MAGAHGNGSIDDILCMMMVKTEDFLAKFFLINWLNQKHGWCLDMLDFFVNFNFLAKLRLDYNF